MTFNIPEILLWLFIINLGTTFGAGVYETRIILPRWYNRLPGSGYTVNVKELTETDTGRKFWVFVTTIPLTLLTIANLVVAVQSKAPRHDWWLAAACITLIDRMGTFIFFIPTVIKLQHPEKLPPAKVSGLISWWLRMNYVRISLVLLAWLAALMALSLTS